MLKYIFLTGARRYEGLENHYFSQFLLTLVVEKFPL